MALPADVLQCTEVSSNEWGMDEDVTWWWWGWWDAIDVQSIGQLWTSHYNSWIDDGGQFVDNKLGPHLMSWHDRYDTFCWTQSTNVYEV